MEGGVRVIKELTETLEQLIQAVDSGDAERTLHLARKYVRIYKQCYPNK